VISPVDSMASTADDRSLVVQERFETFPLLTHPAFLVFRLLPVSFLPENIQRICLLYPFQIFVCRYNSFAIVPLRLLSRPVVWDAYGASTLPEPTCLTERSFATPPSPIANAPGPTRPDAHPLFSPSAALRVSLPASPSPSHLSSCPPRL